MDRKQALNKMSEAIKAQEGSIALGLAALTAENVHEKLAWVGDTLMRESHKLAEMRKLYERLEREDVGQWAEIVEKFERYWMKNALRLAARGSDRSTGGMQRVAEEVEMAFYAQLADPDTSMPRLNWGFGYVLHTIQVGEIEVMIEDCIE